jgi:lipopolysaccharide export system permease protein
VYIREKTSSGKLLGILVHDETNPEKPITYMAEEGAFIKTSAGPRFFMKQGNLQEVQKDLGKLSILYFDDYTLDVSQYEKKSSSVWRKPSTRYFSELMWPEDTALAKRNRDKILRELHTRIALPLYAIALTLISLAGVMGGEFTRRGRSKKIMAASAAGIISLVVGMVLFNLSGANAFLVSLIYFWPLFVAALAAHFAAGGSLSPLITKIMSLGAKPSSDEVKS